LIHQPRSRINRQTNFAALNQVTGDNPMRRLRNTCLVTLLLASSSFQFDRFIAAQSPQAPQQRQEQSGAKAQAAEQKQPDYSQEAYVIERMTTSYRFEKDGTGQREQSLRVKVQSDAGVESFGQLVFPYNSANEKLDIEHVSVLKPDGSEVYALAAAGYRPAPEARENLTRLAGKDKVESLLGKAKAELNELRAIKLGSLLKGEKERLEAEFYIVAVPGADRSAVGEGARFIRGAEKLRPFTGAIKGAKYTMSFPDETATKLIRRGTLTCQPNNGECSFVLLPPEEITSVD
jgi:Domain of Unknown Function with PDB structure (DUF3857)